jgi:hypothetical protein
MRFLLAAMMIVFALSGLAILGLSLQEVMHKLTRRHRFERTQGVIVDIRTKTMSGTNSNRSRPMIMHFPVVTFHTRTGKAVTFRSEIGDSGPVSRYTTGQQLAVLYDPEEEVSPMLDNWSGVWLPSMMLAVAGCGFLAGAILIYWGFWDRIVGRSP